MTALTFGTLPLLSSTPGAAYTIQAASDGTDWGNPEAVVANVASMLMDGDRAEITRFGNRTATIKLRVTGATLDDVSAGEAAIMAEVNSGRNTLTWVPPGTATPSVFDVIYSNLPFNFDDYSENLPRREFTLTLICLPFARRDTLSTVTATPASTPTVTPINDTTSTTNWSTTAAGGSVVDLGATGVRGTSAPSGTYRTYNDLRLSGMSASFTATDYLLIEWDTSVGWAYEPTWSLTVVVGGVTSIRTLQAVETVSGERKKGYFNMPAGTLSQMTFKLSYGNTPTSHTLDIYSVAKVNQLPYYGTPRQRSLVANVGGTARTTANVRVNLSASANFTRDFLLFTAPVGKAISPPMRRYLFSSSAVTTDATLVSGASHTFGVPSVYKIPAASIPPGTHLIVGFLKQGGGSVTPTLSWTASMEATFATTATDASDSKVVDFNTGGVGIWGAYALGVVDLPLIALPSMTDANVKLTFSSSTPGTVVDEIWLFNLDTGDLTWLNDLNSPTGSRPEIRGYEVRSASVDDPRPDWRVGEYYFVDKDISAANRAVSAGVHEFRPGVMSIFIVTPGDVGQTVTGTWYERFRNHVPAPGS
jgi:hypothetical protein